MNSYLKNTIATIAGTLCLLILLTQNSVAQSGSRDSGYQLQPTPLTQTQPAATQDTYRNWQAPEQRFESSPYQPQQTQPREITRFGVEQYDHRALDSLLQKYVNQNGDVDYGTWQSNTEDRSALTSYLSGMNSVDTSLRSNRPAEMAFWINAYNALTIEGILQLFPIRSIKDYAPAANGLNIWDDFKLPVGGSEYSLNDIEHKILRKMGDPRIHFAIVCASKGCPQLSQRAYFADSLEQQLAYSAGLFFRTPSKFSYDLQRGQLGLSPIIQWFGDDFGRNDQERLQYLSQFMPADARTLVASSTPAISYLDYDWSLNLAPARSTTVRTQTLRPQTLTTRQTAPIQFLDSQGSGTRERLETYRPRKPQGQRHCGQGGCAARSVNDYRGIGG